MAATPAAQSRRPPTRFPCRTQAGRASCRSSRRLCEPTEQSPHLGAPGNEKRRARAFARVLVGSATLRQRAPLMTSFGEWVCAWRAGALSKLQCVCSIWFGACVSVSVCVCVCARARVCTCVCVAMRAPAPPPHVGVCARGRSYAAATAEKRIRTLALCIFRIWLFVHS